MKTTSRLIDQECAAIGAIITEGINKLPLSGNEHVMKARIALKEAQRQLRFAYDEAVAKGD